LIKLFNVFISIKASLPSDAEGALENSLPSTKLLIYCSKSIDDGCPVQTILPLLSTKTQNGIPSSLKSLAD